MGTGPKAAALWRRLLRAARTSPRAAGPDLKVLVAQWTLDRRCPQRVNLQWRAEGAATSEEVGQIVLDIPAPTGCTDPTAVNYLSYAASDDGSCLYPEPSYIGLTYEDVTAEVGTPSGMGLAHLRRIRRRQ